MSQDQPKQPEPEKTEPKTPVPKPELDQSGTTLQRLSQTLQQTWRRTQPVLRSQSIKVLRATIRILEEVLAKLEAEPPKSTSAGESPNAGPTTTVESLESQGVPRAPSVPASGAPDRSKPISSLEGILDKFRPRLEQLQGWWNVALGKIRSWLPESVNQNLSDTALTGVVTGILVILLWTTSSLLPGKPSKVAIPPPQRNLPTIDLTTPPELSAPGKPQPVEVSPPPPEPVATPLPTPELSPEQQLIADIQAQVAEISNPYAGRLIQSVQTNFQGSYLTLRASDDWYNLSPSQQDQLADELLDRTQKFDFSKLELIDSHNTLLARSPVVGIHMVILKRQIASPPLANS